MNTSSTKTRTVSVPGRTLKHDRELARATFRMTAPSSRVTKTVVEPIVSAVHKAYLGALKSAPGIVSLDATAGNTGAEWKVETTLDDAELRVVVEDAEWAAWQALAAETGEGQRRRRMRRRLEGYYERAQVHVDFEGRN